MASKTLKLRLTRSLIGLSPKQEATVRALGLRRMNQTVTQVDTATIRGMIAKVPHVLQVTHEA
ncbi:MAG: 50S ribosomal protein L30 [Candidatus Rokubacteria bacterium]|nr:50S ribosomal protein L30 [Candidatus Rokubacteria bacterium]MBI4593570.1 50S ribosomal protein L30 [Candidatus Rokubacteria bacterium]